LAALFSQAESIDPRWIGICKCKIGDIDRASLFVKTPIDLAYWQGPRLFGLCQLNRRMFYQLLAFILFSCWIQEDLQNPGLQSVPFLYISAYFLFVPFAVFLI
jgi:hypothetical protein